MLLKPITYGALLLLKYSWWLPFFHYRSFSFSSLLVSLFWSDSCYIQHFWIIFIWPYSDGLCLFLQFSQRFQEDKVCTSHSCRLQPSTRNGTQGGPSCLAARVLVSSCQSGGAAASLNSVLVAWSSSTMQSQFSFWISFLVPICCVFLVESGH